MAVSDTSKIDFLWKKVMFGVTKSDSATAKSGSNETIASNLPVYGNTIWGEADLIPATPPATTTSVVTVMGSTALSADPTATLNVSWVTTQKEWIPPTFGSGYAVKVYVGNPDSGGTQIYPDTSGYEFMFDYNAGVVHFMNAIPAGIAAGIYIKGYRYAGKKGLASAVAANASKNYVVADIAARDALTGVNNGDTVFVKDASAIPADAGAGEYAIYMKVDGVYTLVSTKDSSGSDSKTTQYLLTSSSVGTIPFSRAGNGARIISCSIDVIVPFDGTLDITIGDTSNQTWIMSAFDHDLKSIGSYVVTPTTQLTTTQETQLNIYSTGASTIGQAKVTITYA